VPTVVADDDALTYAIIALEAAAQRSLNNAPVWDLRYLGERPAAAIANDGRAFSSAAIIAATALSGRSRSLLGAVPRGAAA
jgi:hypothetical protein